MGEPPMPQNTATFGSYTHHKLHCHFAGASRRCKPQRGELMTSVLEAGTVAPDFTLHVTPDQKLSLSELRGRPVILAFYPADWSPVCGDQMALYNEVLPEFGKYGAELLGIS